MQFWEKKVLARGGGGHAVYQIKARGKILIMVDFTTMGIEMLKICSRLNNSQRKIVFEIFLKHFHKHFLQYHDNILCFLVYETEFF